MRRPHAPLAGLALLAGTGVVVLAATGCGATRATAVPDVTGLRLDVAEDMLDTAGLRYATAGGGDLGIVVRSHWVVCRQQPSPGTVARSVTLVVARSCAPAAQMSVPDVVGERLEEAESRLERAGLGVRVESVDGDPVVVESLWTVCGERPGPGVLATSVVLRVAHDCGAEEDD